jgi:PAS domain S-box-containing protein
MVPPESSMSPRAAQAVSSAIAAVRSALARIDRTRATDVVRRGEAEAVLAKLAELPVAILIANDRARYVEVNAAATTLTGYSRSELLRMSVWDLTPQPDRSTGMTAWEGFLRTGEQSGTYSIKRKDGTVIHAVYFATAHVLPSLHLSALATLSLVRSPVHHGGTSRPLTSRGNSRLSGPRTSPSRTRR